MLAHTPIRYKLLLGAVLLLMIVGILAFSGFRGVYAYRELTRGISQRSAELPKSVTLTKHVDALRFIVSQASAYPGFMDNEQYDLDVRWRFRDHLQGVTETLREYQALLDTAAAPRAGIGDLRQERQTVRDIDESLQRIKALDHDEEWNLRLQTQLQAIAPELDLLHELTNKLPSHLLKRMGALQQDVRVEYRTWIVLTWTSSVATVVMLIVLGYYFELWIFRPLRILVAGSRRVAADDFDYRIILNTHDEMAELAGAMNAMTARFREIRDDLNRQVRQRTREVLRSEQLASVGFLAAGVAHEINNPLASIAWAAEALESRAEELLLATADDQNEDWRSQAAVLRKYLRRIQEEAFRCKGITEGLLDFSRLGHGERQDTELGPLVESVVDMVQHLGSYRGKHISCRCQAAVVAPVNPQELKQVVLNLVTNALDSIDPGGRVTMELQTRQHQAVLTVTDNGCGMTEEVKEHLFEPFFTRRRSGQGTGLGLSITYRIIQDHGGTIEAHSDGPGHGSQFRVLLPLVRHEEIPERRFQAA